MKRKDILTIVACLVMIGVAIYFGLKLMGIGFSSNNNATSSDTQVQDIYVPGELDIATMEEVNKLNDYGEASLDNIGRVNPFGPL